MLYFKNKNFLEAMHEFFYSRFGRFLLVLLAGTMVGAMVFVGYQWHFNNRAHKASMQLFLDIEDMQKAFTATDYDWKHLGDLLQKQIDELGETNITPLLMKLYAQVLTMQGNPHDALLLTDRLMTKITTTNPLYQLFATQRAILALDQDDEQVRTAALDQLRALAHDENNTYRDAALYYLGSYCWINNDLVQATAAWQTLVDLQRDVMVVSPWAQEVVPLIEQVQFLVKNMKDQAV